MEPSSSSSPRLSGILTELGGGGTERSLGMERLSKNLCLEIFRLLDCTSLAAAAHVCREWRRLASDDELWSELFKKRWGSDCAASYAPTGSKSWKDVYAVRQASEDDASWYRLFKKRWGSGNAVFYAPRGSKSWKDVYEAHDRCDRLDLDLKLIRKGGDYYVIRGDYIHKYVPSGEGAKLPPGFGDRKKIDSASLEEDE